MEVIYKHEEWTTDELRLSLFDFYQKYAKNDIVVIHRSKGGQLERKLVLIKELSAGSYRP